ncbi:DUF4179 domain-containing protein [Bacillus alkalicellulosilyticus]|uniref:DUF4179 domain-containing protein n=1 Tax=Alkalihalobacterium alkalicellulosilyticum TaxID=1912214 RepID=UPI0009962A39|nr:DUF4179 domain-containing protein [Bacillus alkalicellulosilyticus]
MKNINKSKFEIEKSLKNIKENIIVPDIDGQYDSNKIYKFKQRKTIWRYKVVTAFTMVFLLCGTGTYAAFTYIFNNDSSDKGLTTAEVNGKVSYSNYFSEKQNLRVTVDGVITDGVRTVLHILFEGSEVKGGIPEIEEIYLVDEDGVNYPVTHWGQGDIKNNNKFDETIIEFDGSPLSKTNLKLSLKNINGIQDQWDIQFPVTPTNVKIYNTNSKASTDNFELEFSKVTFTSTYTILEGKSKNFDFTNSAKLSNSTGKVELLKSEGQEEDDLIKLFFPPIEESDRLTLEITSFENQEILSSLSIPIQ